MTISAMTFPETTTALLASATFTGIQRDSFGAGTGALVSEWAFFNATFFSDQAGTGYLQESATGVTWVTVAQGALTISVPLVLSAPITQQFCRVLYTNGGTNQGSFTVNSSFTTAAPEVNSVSSGGGGTSPSSNVNLAQVAGTNTVTGGVAGSLGVGGLGVAGTPAGGVVSVQGVSGGTPENSNLAQINGAPPSLTNPIYTAYAEAGDTTGTFTNATQATAITATNADGYATALVSINGTYGTASGTFQASDDGGVTFYNISCVRSDGTAVETGYTNLTNTNRQWFCPISGNDSFRIQSSAVASGTVNARISISAPPTNSAVVSGPTGTGANQVQGTQASGAADNGSFPIKLGSVFNTTLPTYTNGQYGALQMTARGAINTTLFDASGNVIGSSNQSSDAISTSVVGLNVQAFGYTFDGTNETRSRSVVGALAAGSAGTGTTAVESGGTLFSQITTGTSTTVKGSAAILHKVCVNTPVASATIKIYNALSATGTPITITIPSTVTGESPFFIEYDIYMGTGIFVVTSGATDVTVTYR